MKSATSLCNTVYKIVSKVLVNRFKPVISSLISINKNAFIPKRSIFDNILIGHEIYDFIKKEKNQNKPLYFAKLDISKAYDRLKWEFIRNVLRKMNFSEKWVDLVWECISSVKFSVVVNGNCSPFFCPSRGLRQGDPLSPYLFILCTEALSASLNFLNKEKIIRGISMGQRSTPINHLLFADDCFISFEVDSTCQV